MRIRIALATTATVIVAVPVLLLTLFNGTPAASARVTRHEAIGQHRVEKIDFKVMSYAQAQDVAKLADYYNAISVSQQESYLREVNFYQTLEKQSFFRGLLQQQAAAAAAAAARARVAATAVTPAHRPRHPLRPLHRAVGPTRPAPIRLTGRAYARTNRGTITPKVAEVRISSSSRRGTR